MHHSFFRARLVATQIILLISVIVQSPEMCFESQFLSVIFQIDSHFLYFYFILSIYSISQSHNNNKKNPKRWKSGLKIDGLVLECTQVTKWTRPTSVCDWNKLRLSPPISILLQWIAKKTIWHFFSVNLQMNYDVNIGLIKRRQRQ